MGPGGLQGPLLGRLGRFPLVFSSYFLAFPRISSYFPRIFLVFPRIFIVLPRYSARTSCFATSPLRKCVSRPPKADHLEGRDSACLGVSRLFYSGLSWPIHTSDLVFCYKSPARMLFFDPLSSHFLVFPRIFLAFPCFFLVFSSHYLVFPRIFLVFPFISSYFPR